MVGRRPDAVLWSPPYTSRLSRKLGLARGGLGRPRFAAQIDPGAHMGGGLQVAAVDAS